MLAALALAAACPPLSAAQAGEPEGYRMENFRAPVPASLKGAEVVTTQEVAGLWRNKEAVFFDVMPDTPKPKNLPAGTIWRDKKRSDIPGSVWLANVGYGALSKETEAYFRDALARHAKGKDGKILFYCMTDCWMSWNAAKRALEWGYTDVLWYPSGADGWEKAGMPLKENRPYGID